MHAVETVQNEQMSSAITLRLFGRGVPFGLTILPLVGVNGAGLALLVLWPVAGLSGGHFQLDQQGARRGQRDVMGGDGVLILPDDHLHMLRCRAPS